MSGQILLVDHDRDLRNFLSKAFRAEGYGVPCSDPSGGRAAAYSHRCPAPV